MARTKKRIPSLIEFKRPVYAGSRSPTRIATILNEKLDKLCTELGINSSDPYRDLCIVLLTDVIQAKGFQVVDKIPRWRGNNTRWTLQKHFELMQFVDKQLKAGTTQGRAFGLACKRFALDLKDGSIKTEYNRAKRLFAAAARTATPMKLIGSGPHAARHVELFLASPTRLKTPRKAVKARSRTDHSRKIL